jgi:carboxymethylenebutenolidase
MCFDVDSHPPSPPSDLVIAGGAAAEALELTSADGTQFSAALAQSAHSRGCGVVILPDVRGLYRFYTELAERFAEAGHHAIVIDYFGRTAGLGTRNEDFDFLPHIHQLRVAQAQADALAAADELRERTGVTSVATVGFCVGGFLSFLAGADIGHRLAAVVGFYGILQGSLFDIREPLERTDEITCPVLGLFGGDDPTIPVAQVEEFEARLTAARVDHEIHVYPGAPHSFFDRGYEQHADATQDAWRRALDFLGRHGA